jgi:hypothetical protein
MATPAKPAESLPRSAVARGLPGEAMAPNTIPSLPCSPSSPFFILSVFSVPPW